MRYMLDTDICVTLIRQKSPELRDKIKSFKPETLGISVITLAELQYGVQKGQRQKLEQEALMKVLFPFKVVDFNSEAAVTYGHIRADLEKIGQRIGPYDLQIAAHAKTLGVILVTGNVREFNRVDGLIVENWLR